MAGIPVITAERLCLRPFRDDDVASMLKAYTDDVVMRYLPKRMTDPAALLEGFAHFEALWRANGFGVWAVSLSERTPAIGHCGLNYLDGTPEVEVLYLLDRPWWGRGLATEAAHAAVVFAFEHLGLEHVAAVTDPLNLGSRRVLTKLGMRFQGYSRHYQMRCAYFRLTAEDFERDG